MAPHVACLIAMSVWLVAALGVVAIGVGGNTRPHFMVRRAAS